MNMDIICIGEALIDFLAVQSGTRFRDVTEFRRVAGGAPANVAVGTAKLGKKSAFIGRVGRDEFGFYLRDMIAGNGVNVEQLQYDDEARTGLAFIALPTPTTREFLFYRNPSADMFIDQDKFNVDLLRSTKILHFGSITLIREPSRSSTLKAIEIAKDAGALISYDPNLRTDLWSDSAAAKKQMLAALPLADTVKLNDEELEFLTGVPDISEGAERIISSGPEIVFVTLGAEGSFYATSRFSGSIPTFDVKTVDSTGCGDSFVSGLLAFLAEKDLAEVLDNKTALAEAVKVSNAAASITSMKKGVIPSLPSKKELEEFLETHEL
jgi:fructokinase